MPQALVKYAISKTQITMEKEQVNLKSEAFMYIAVQAFLGVTMFAATYWVFIWDANLYNALVTVDDRTWREWALIVSSVIFGPSILMSFTLFIRNVWYGTIYYNRFPPRMKR